MVGETREPDGETGPLDGLTVVDASQVLVGPFCTMQLGDLGAEIIKIERPGVGDRTRQWVPPTYGESEESAYYLSVNRNKRSVELDLSTPAGRAVFSDLASEADVVVENFRVGKTAKWGLEYGDLAPENPGLVYCSISGYGEWGPDRDEPAYDVVMQARGGMMSITGEEGGPPVRVGVAIADIGAGMYATQAILAALLERELGDGTGQKVEVSLLDCQAAWMSYQAENYFATGDSPGRMGSKHPNIVPYSAFESADGHVVVACTDDVTWRALCEALELPELAAADRFSTNEKRVQNREVLEPALEEAFGEYTTAGLLERLETTNVPASDVKNMEAVFSDSQIDARGMRREVEHPTAGDVEMPGSPMFLSRTPATIRRPPPRLGEHTAGVLEEYGYGEGDLERLRTEGAIPDRP